MRHFLFLIIIILFGLLQTTILDYIGIFGVKPDLLLISAIVSCFCFDFGSALFLSIIAGILKDIISTNPFGLNTILFPSLSYLIIKLSKKISIDNDAVRAILMFVVVLISDIAVRFIFILLGNTLSWGIFLRIAFLESLYAALVLPLVFKVTQDWLITEN